MTDHVPVQDFLRRFAQRHEGGDPPYEFSDVREGLVVGLLSIGSLLGALLAAPLSNRVGRRMAMITACVIFYVGNTIQIAAMTAWYQVAIGRLICGLSVGSLSGKICKSNYYTERECHKVLFNRGRR